jgi:hypothetical protein
MFVFGFGTGRLARIDKATRSMKGKEKSHDTITTNTIKTYKLSKRQKKELCENSLW